MIWPVLIMIGLLMVALLCQDYQIRDLKQRVKNLECQRKFYQYRILHDKYAYLEPTNVISEKYYHKE